MIDDDRKAAMSKQTLGRMIVALDEAAEDPAVVPSVMIGEFLVKPNQATVAALAAYLRDAALADPPHDSDDRPLWDRPHPYRREQIRGTDADTCAICARPENATVHDA